MPVWSSQSRENKNLNSHLNSLFKRLQTILVHENIEFDPKVLVELINKHFPDYRRVLNECQRYSVGGKIDSAILAEFSDVKVNDLVKYLKEKISQKYDVGSLIIWTMILVYFLRVYDALHYTLEDPFCCCRRSYYC